MQINELKNLFTRPADFSSVSSVNKENSTVPSQTAKTDAKDNLNLKQQPVTLNISKDAAVVKKLNEQDDKAQFFTGNNFSTHKDEEKATEETARATGSMLDQYRFFVRTSQYEDSDGAVRRIFR